MNVMYELPDDDAPMSDWMKPVSGKLTTREHIYFSGTEVDKSGGVGSLTQNLRRILKRKRAKARQASEGAR